MLRNALPALLLAATAASGCGLVPALEGSWAGSCEGRSDTIDLQLDNVTRDSGAVPTDSAGDFRVFRGEATLEDGSGEVREAFATLVECTGAEGCTVSSVGEVEQGYVELNVVVNTVFLLTGDLEDRRTYAGDCFFQLGDMPLPDQGTFTLRK